MECLLFLLHVTLTLTVEGSALCNGLKLSLATNKPTFG